MYATVPSSEPLVQGDIIDGCPVFALESASASVDIDGDPKRWKSRVIVLTQACDLAQAKSVRALVALMHTAQDLVNRGAVKATTVRDQIRRGQVYGWYFLPAAPAPVPLPESLVDLHDLHTISRPVLEHLIATGRRVCRVLTPYREHLAQHFAVTYMRIGLPEPYQTEP